MFHTAWKRVIDTFRKRPKLISRILFALPALWILFDFVTFSFGTIPASRDSVQVTGSKRVPVEQVRSEIFRKLRTVNAENLIEVDLAELSDYLTQRIPAIRSVTVTKNIGRGVMTVAVVERTGVAIIRSSLGWLEVDREGVLYTAAEPSRAGLAEVTGLAGSTIVPGRNLFEHPSGAGLLRVVLSLPARMPAAHLKSVRIIRPDYYELEFSSGVIVKADPVNFPDKVDRLQKILFKVARPAAVVASAKPSARSTGERAVSYIDVRFEQDVIAYKPETPQERGKQGR